MPTLGNAFVQIVPSSRGISGSISKVLNNEADKAGTMAGETAGGKLVGMLKKAVVAAGLGKVITDTIVAGAGMEQALGGIETLFKDSAGKVEQYAREAYKNTGISATEYMEQATSFSASLLQSLKGDTNAAAEAANTAINDMADNAAKMGTSIESIQNAYQGFAKQNYTMLDNLKLGYGGTKTEMERLLKDATKLSGVKYDINNLSDVYSAIHVIQQNMGLTGVAANEAATTLSGSFNSMKAAAKDFMANLALGRDVGASLQNLVKSVVTFAKDNLLPALINIFGELPDALYSMVPSLLSSLYAFMKKVLSWVQTQLPAILAQGREAIDGFINGMEGGEPAIITAIKNILKTVWQVIEAATPQLLRFGLEMVGKLALGAVRALPTLAAKAGDLITGFASAIMSALPQIVSIGVEILGQLVVGILEAIPQLLTSAGAIISSLISAIMGYLPTLIEQGRTLLTTIGQGIRDNLPTIIETAAAVIAQIAATIATNLPTLLQTGIELILEIATGIINGIPQLISKLPELFARIAGAFKEYDWKTLGNDIVQGIINGVKNAGGALLDAIRNLASQALSAVKAFLGIKSPSKVFANQVGAQIPAGIALGITKNSGVVDDALTDLSFAMTPGYTAAGAAPAGGAINIYIDGIKYNTDEYIDSSVRGFVQNVFRLGQTFSR